MSVMPGGNPTEPGSGLKLTYDDLLLFSDDGRRHELIDGEHYVTPSPNRKHQAIVGNLYYVIRQYLENRRAGRIFAAPFDVLFSKFDVVEPDLLFVSAERLEEVLTPEHVRGAPDLVVEVGSKGTQKRDETVKRRLYERGGVKEYWVVDPERDTVRVYRQSGRRLHHVTELALAKADMLTTPLLPGLEIPLTRLFED